MKSKVYLGLEYMLIVAMGILLAFNYYLFIVPNDFAPAGVNGIAVMVQYKLNFSIGYMSLLINIPLCLLAYFFVNKKFAVRSLVFCLTYSAFYLLLQKQTFLAPFRYDAGGIDTVYPVMIAGLLSGFVYGILFRISSCTGGTDIVAHLVAKKHPQLNFFWVTFSLNVVVALSSFFVYAQNDGGVTTYNLKPICLCMLYCFMSSYIGTFMLKESRSACEFILITKHPEEIEKVIKEKLHHSATRLQGHGIYSGEENTVLLCLVNKNQVSDFETILRDFPDVFSIEQTVNRALGNFKKIK